MDALTRQWRETFDPDRMAFTQALQQPQPLGPLPCLHCWHPFLGAWAGSQPAPMHCCWCGQERDLQEAMLSRHGPYAEGRHG